MNEPTPGSPRAPRARRKRLSGWMRRQVYWRLIYALVVVYGRTLRIQSPDEAMEPLLRAQAPGKGLILALWHGPHLPLLMRFRHRGATVIVSRSSDGEMLARILEKFGYHTVRGSSSAGGMRAMIDLARRVQAGRDVALAVDGPRGPRCLAKPGAVRLAKMTGSVIVPVGIGIARCHTFRSWDRFQLPYPFTRCYLVPGEPLRVNPQADDAQLEAALTQLQHALEQAQQRADQRAGVSSDDATVTPR